MEPTPTHQLYFTPTGQLTPAGRDAIASTRATARRLLAIRKSIAMKPTTSPHQSMELPNTDGVYFVNRRSILCPPWRRRYEARVIINHNPSRLPYWPIVATPEIGCFGRFRWINSMPSEGAWGRVWWSNR